MLVIDASAVAELLLGACATTSLPNDAVYLALAEALTDAGVPLLTADPRFARAARAHSAIDTVLVV